MIDHPDNSPRKDGAKSPLLNPTAPPPPPAYDHQEGTYPARQYPNVQPYPAVQSYSVFAYREPTWRRFLRAFLVAVAVWVLMGMFVQSLVYVARWNHRHTIAPPAGGWTGYPIPSGINAEECAKWEEKASTKADYVPKQSLLNSTSFPRSAETSFSLPVDSDVLFLLARGPSASGSVDITSSPEQDSKTVTVYVQVKYYRQYILDAVRVCSVTRGESENEAGVGIFTPDWLRREDRWGRQLSFETTIVFPEPQSLYAAPLLVKKLETDIYNTWHRVTRLENKVHFNKFSISGSNGVVTVDSVFAEEISINTSNSGITGTFNTTKEIVLKTTNGAIKVAVGLNNVMSNNVIPKLHAQTSNGLLDASIALLGGHQDLDSSSPKYRVYTTTSNSPLTVQFTDSPVDPVLTYEGRTSNALASVKLHPAYQGTYSVRTSNAPVELRDGHVEDPSGKGRTRNVTRDATKVRNYIGGTIAWLDKDGHGSVGDGSVKFSTSNHRAFLEI